jgi:hypothetical protein
MFRQPFKAIVAIRPLWHALVIVGPLMVGSFAHATTCYPVAHQFENAAIVIKAMSRRVEFEPSDMDTPEIANFVLPITESNFATQPDPQAEMNVTGCSGSHCYSWIGTRDSLPATETVTWYEVELAVTTVWRGSVNQTVLAIFAGGRYPEPGEEYIIAFNDAENGHFTFRSPCQAMVTADELFKYSDVLGRPLYTYE